MTVGQLTKPKQTAEPIPPLENGDRLTSAEFQRRYMAMPHVKKAELIKGVVYMPSPLRYGQHGNQHFHVIGWLSQYMAATPGVDGGDNCTVKLDIDNVPQPDVMLIVLPEYGGQSRIDDEDYVAGAPELVAEVAASSASYDLHDKLDVYRENGVREYVVWRVLDHRIDWYILSGDRYEALPLDADGYFRSRVFPGLWLDPQALLAGNLATVFQVVQQGVADPGHARFVADLAKRRLSPP